jgi:mitochondrial import inner membrane translocase subunit TIM13
MALFGSSSSDVTGAADPSSTELKNALIQQVQTEAAVGNARALVAVSHSMLAVKRMEIKT